MIDKISLNGKEYYVANGDPDSLVVINGCLVNISNNQITLYDDIYTYNESVTGDSKIYCPSMTKAYYREGSTYSSYSNINVSVSDFSVVSKDINSNFLLLVIIVGVLVCQLLKR